VHGYNIDRHTDAEGSRKSQTVMYW